MNSRILPSLALMLSIAVFFVYINRVWSGSIATTKIAIAADDQALQAAENFKKQQNQLLAEKNEIDPANLERLATLLPGSVDNVHLILDLNALAARSGLSLSNIDVAAPPVVGATTLPSADSNPIGSVDLSLTAIGTYSSLQTFLVGVEHSARLLDVQDISTTGSDSGVYSYQMKIRLYWLH